ncbi:MAG: alginate O-acetyltransferase complex protein AlgI [Flammeovirgaceae bacterium]|jgi:alginate O-acetyltransferase complex protein AlgI
MLFNSFQFMVFLVIAFSAYWLFFHRQRALRNVFLLAASYVFYGWWDYRFLGLIAFSTAVDFLIGQYIHHSEKSLNRKLLLATSLLVNLGLLAYFKYANFFIESFADFSQGVLGLEANMSSLAIILPVGISFYTFQTLSYTIDIYRKRLDPTNNIVEFAAFVSFFPQLVAGPIERASNLLPQFKEKKKFRYEDGSEGMRLIVWGLFKKTVIADNCAPYVNEIFSSYQDQPAAVLFMGAILFAFQIYGDFSGYSDIAIGTARLFGFRLMTNFNYPYFSRDVAEFWRRWHISLSTWFRDYLYIPLGGSRKSMKRTLTNVLIIFVVSGFWHGANWTFIVWGGLHALYIMPVVAFGLNRKHLDGKRSLVPKISEIAQIGLTFFLVCVAWIFFRAPSVGVATDYLFGMVQRPVLPENFYFFPPWLLGLIGFMVLSEWIGKNHTPEKWIGIIPKWGRYGFYLLLFGLWFLFASSEKQAFIYFQF